MEFRFDHTWSLFLDRDGVINRRLVDDYVLTPGQFEFLDGVPEAVARFSALFGHIFVVTNQQGIGKGLMTEEALHEIHRRMVDQLEQAGGRIDRIYFSPYLAEQRHFMRKPATGMARAAKRDFPDILLSRSIMVGDSLSDMRFGRRAGMKTVLVGDARIPRAHPLLVDAFFPDLITFANHLKITETP